MYILKHSNWPGRIGIPGTWTTDEAGRVNICCPRCNKIGTLDDHTISSRGEVSPSTICPRKGCGFHKTFILGSYKEKGRG